jgi:hypothetical protein
MYVAALLLMMRCDSVLVCSNVGVCGGGGGGDGNDANNDCVFVAHSRNRPNSPKKRFTGFYRSKVFTHPPKKFLCRLQQTRPLSQK